LLVARDTWEVDPGKDALRLPEVKRRRDAGPVSPDVGGVQLVRLAEHASDCVQFVDHAVEKDGSVRGANRRRPVANRGLDTGRVLGFELGR
jgi:hypothetical protein